MPLTPSFRVVINNLLEANDVFEKQIKVISIFKQICTYISTHNILYKIKGFMVNCTWVLGPDLEKSSHIWRWGDGNKIELVEATNQAYQGRGAMPPKLITYGFQEWLCNYYFLEPLFISDVLLSTFQGLCISTSLHLCKLGALLSHFPKRNWSSKNVPSVTRSLSLSVIELGFEPVPPDAASLSTLQTFSVSYNMEPTTWVLLRSVCIWFKRSCAVQGAYYQPCAHSTFIEGSVFSA